MKKLLQILFFNLFVLSFSQSYKPLLVDGNKWYVSTLSSYAGGPLCMTDESYYYIEKDTLINNNIYKKINSKITKNCPINTIVGVCFCNNTNVGNVYLAAYLREDVAQKKVFIYSKVNNKDYILYDFAAKVGDHVDFFTGYSNNQTLTLPITEKGTGNVFGSEVNYSAYHNGLAYEGIGSHSGLLRLPDYKPFELPTTWLSCFENTAGISCQSNIVLGIKENNAKKNLTLYYSKESQDFRVLGNATENYSVQFYESSGVMVGDVNTKGNQRFILKNQQKGSVLFYTISNGKSTWNGKVIIP